MEEPASLVPSSAGLLFPIVQTSPLGPSGSEAISSCASTALARRGPAVSSAVEAIEATVDVAATIAVVPRPAYATAFSVSASEGATAWVPAAGRR